MEQKGAGRTRERSRTFSPPRDRFSFWFISSSSDHGLQSGREHGVSCHLQLALKEELHRAGWRVAQLFPRLATAFDDALRVLALPFVDTGLVLEVDGPCAASLSLDAKNEDGAHGACTLGRARDIRGDGLGE